MTPEGNSGPARYALLQNGSSFACEVLQGLQQRGFAPDLLVLPEYPPACAPASVLMAAKPESRLTQLAGDIEIAYAPQAEQSRFAERLRRAGFDFLLVACWPYLIEPAIVNSVKRIALNLHPSLLPAYRGPDPIGAQIKRGESCTGVSLHLLTPRFDQGDILAQAPLADTAPGRDRKRLESACASAGCELFIKVLTGYHADWPLMPQNDV